MDMERNKNLVIPVIETLLKTNSYNLRKHLRQCWNAVMFHDSLEKFQWTWKKSKDSFKFFVRS